jgi:hypothetical protein
MRTTIHTTDFEPYGGSAVIRNAGNSYERWTAQRYQDEPADLTPRQAMFYRNLIILAERLQTRDLPVDFELVDGHRVYLDHGCIKIAEHAGFIEPLRNGPSGLVETVRLAWHVRRSD